MDQVKIGKFLQQRRKECGLTQSELAEKLSVSDRAISKWENGNCLPDADHMIELCDILGITVNDLFSGEVVGDAGDTKELESSLVAMTKLKQQSDKRLLGIEIVLGVFSVVLFLAGDLVAGLVAMPLWARIIVGISAFALFLVGMAFGLRIEQKAGYYKCANCGHTYVPKFSAVFFAMHVNRTRYMKCPHCGKSTWQRKVLTNDKETTL
ncbi:MAG: helix-turn-helix domain-containing protein [Clostridia bacterium]|nr:helix-turn-helix domain-containing protein [Clostridia bacterium]